MCCPCVARIHTPTASRVDCSLVDCSFVPVACYAAAMSSKYLLLLAAAVVVGGVVPVQAVVNSRLGALLGTSFSQKVTATTISFVGGTLTVLVLWMIATGGTPKLETSLKEIPALLFTGGVYGVIFVTASIMLVPRLGAAATIGGMLCGQMIMSVIFDQISFLGTPKIDASPMRIGGLMLMMVGLLLLSQRPAQASAATDPPRDTALDVPAATQDRASMGSSER